jgi:hypothetical protein
MQDKNSGWKEIPLNGTVYSKKVSDNQFDILYTDARNEPISSLLDGASVVLLRKNPNEMAFMVSSPDKSAIEIYDFMKDNQGNNILNIISSLANAMSIYRSSIEIGNCSFINFIK